MRKFDIRTIDLNLLHVFIVLWDTRSVSRASEALAITQPAVSHALKRLRERLGDPLFVASRSGLVATPRAVALELPVREALDRIRSALEAAPTFEPSSAQREFRIGMLDLVEYWLLPALVGLVQEEAPGVVLHGVALPEPVVTPDLLEGGELDVVLTDREPAEKTIRTERLYEEHLTSLVWRREGLTEGRMPLDLFVQRPHVVFQARDPSIDRALAQHGQRRRIGAIAHNFLAMPVVAARTGFICTLPSRTAASFADRFELTAHLPPVATDPWPLFAAWHAGKHTDLGLQWLLAKLRSVVSAR